MIQIDLMKMSFVGGSWKCKEEHGRDAEADGRVVAIACQSF